VQGRPTEFAFNLDEITISDWKDRQAQSVIVPRAMIEQGAHHKVRRRLQHICVIACVSAA
jgi:hypothetical protein